MQFESQIFLVSLAALLGLLFGSFANVVIYRWPQQMSVVVPRSFCPHCKTQLKWFENIPVFSWGFLRGKCRYCQAPISFRYPLVEVIMALLFGYIVSVVGVSWTALEYLIFTFGLVTVSFIDLDHFLLPDIFTLSGILIGLVGAALNPARDFLPAVLGVLLGGGFLWLIAYCYFAWKGTEGMGGGDIKLLAWIGAVLGWSAIPFVIIVASLLGTVIGLIQHSKTENKMTAAIPFGPYLAFGAVLYMLGGSSLGDWYLGLFFP